MQNIMLPIKISGRTTESVMTRLFHESTREYLRRKCFFGMATNHRSLLRKLLLSKETLHITVFLDAYNKSGFSSVRSGDFL